VKARKYLVIAAVGVLALALYLWTKRAPTVYEPGAPASVLGVSMGAIRNAIATRLDSAATPTWVTPDRWKRVRAVYAVWGNAPLWLEPAGVKERATALLKVLEEAPDHALRTDGYPLDSIRTFVNVDELVNKPTAERLADADVLLTAAYVGYGTDMLKGQVDPKTITQAWHIPAPLAEVDSALIRTLQNPLIAQGLADMAPKDSAYTVLKSEYARYRQMVSDGGWPLISLARGDREAAVVARLRAERLPVDSVAGDAETVIRLYQERHGLAETGKLDERTVRSMNVPATERLQQIGSNLERQRWLPRSLGSRYIHVNVPAFRLEAYEGGQKKLEMRVVVGSEFEGRSTPVFSDSMAHVVFRPYWNVTPNIAAKEFFPKYGTNLPDGYETWRENGQLRIRQRPGEGNSLGLVKFMFPNAFNVYLHDTPSKALFAQADRAASHGCIRLEKPDKLAEFVLGWDNAAVQQAMHGADNRTVVIPAKIPVYIVYLTAYVRDGHLHFSDDIYERDQRLESRMGTTGAP
jgi:murein L,D-transpeptidase YcbB/YkuD